MTKTKTKPKRKLVEYGLALVHTSEPYPEPWIGQVIPLGKKCNPASYRYHKRMLQERAKKVNDLWARSSKIIDVKITEV